MAQRLPQHWTQPQPGLLVREGAVPSQNVAAFDLDRTLIHSSKGLNEIYGTRKLDDWVWFSEATPAYLNKLNEDGWSVVIFTNNLIATQHPDLIREVIDRVDNMRRELNFQPLIYIATLTDNNRKPNLGMFNLFREVNNISAASFYCADDTVVFHVNKKFAEACNLPLYAPDEILPEQLITRTAPVTPEIAITMGQYDSGWDTFIIPEFNYQVYEEDDYPDPAALRGRIESGHSLLIRGAFGTIKSREPYVDLARSLKVPFVIYWFGGSPAQHLRVNRGPHEYIAYGMSFQYPHGRTIYRID